MRIVKNHKWDAIAGEDLILFVEPGYCPFSIAYNDHKIVLLRGGEFEEIMKPEGLLEHLHRYEHVTVVEADEGIYRISQIESVRIERLP